MLEPLTECVKESISKIFSSIFGNPPDFLDLEENGKIGDSVLGVISFVGDVTWLLVLSLPRSSANALAFKFTGFEVDYESPDMGDVVGELNNVLAGDIVARLSSKGIKVAMSLPTTMRGHDVEPLLPKGVPQKKLRCSLPGGEIFVKLAGCKPGEIIGKKPGT